MNSPLSTTERQALHHRCHTLFSGHRTLSPAQEFSKLASWCDQHEITADRYGDGALLNQFEARIADVLGKQAAVFLPSGKMAQMIALKIHTERAHIDRFGMHPSSHLELHEERAYAALLQLHGVLVGQPMQPIQVDDLAKVTDPLGCLLLELPMRECGGVLPTWDQLLQLTDAARVRDIPIHMDGARLWECGSYFAPKSLAQIAELFDSVYVSFYKGIGGVSGAMLLGEAPFIAAARTWQIRFGGQLPQQTAAVASAAMRFEEQLLAMPAYMERTRSLAAALSTIPGLAVQPDPPQVNMLHLHFPCPAAALAQARDVLAQRSGIWAFGSPVSTGSGSTAKVEWYVGENLMQIDNAAVVATLTGLIETASRLGGARCT